MTLTNAIARKIEDIQAENHTVHEGIRDMLLEKVGATFDKNDTPAFPLRPSAVLKPLRDLYYDLCNYYKPGSIPKSELEPRVKLIFEFGHRTEDLMMKLFGNAFSVEYAQHRVKYGELKDKDGNIIPLEGSIDWAAKLNGEYVICDSKSIGSFPFKTAPKEDNIAQMQLYMHSDWARSLNINKALLIYFNKDNSDIKVIEVVYDPRLARMLVIRLKRAFNYYKLGIVPPREYFAGCDWRADYSAYRDYDNQEFVGGVEGRKIREIETLAPKYKYPKEAIREHVRKFGRDAVKYSDKLVFVTYNTNKLVLAQLT